MFGDLLPKTSLADTVLATTTIHPWRLSRLLTELTLGRPEAGHIIIIIINDCYCYFLLPSAHPCLATTKTIIMMVALRLADPGFGPPWDSRGLGLGPHRAAPGQGAGDSRPGARPVLMSLRPDLGFDNLLRA